MAWSGWWVQVLNPLASNASMSQFFSFGRFSAVGSNGILSGWLGGIARIGQLHCLLRVFVFSVAMEFDAVTELILGKSSSINLSSFNAVFDRYIPVMLFEMKTICLVVSPFTCIFRSAAPMIPRDVSVIPRIRWRVGIRYLVGHLISFSSSGPAVHVWQPVSATVEISVGL